MNTFQSKLIQANKTERVYLITGQAEGNPAWHYVQVDEPKHKAFLKALETGDLDIADYGKVLESGWGAHPPEPIAARMMERANA
jgi:hypothetical protein